MLTVEQMKSEIEALTKERDALAAEVVRLDAGWHKANGDTLDKALELDNVKAAAKLALLQMSRNQYLVRSGAPGISAARFHAAIEALREAGVQ